MQEEELFPQELIRKAVKPGGEYGWRFEDIPSVVKACQDLEFAISCGQPEFMLPDGTCDMYWLSIDIGFRGAGESWKEYCNRSYSEFLKLFNYLVAKTDFEKEGVVSFSYLAEKKESGVNILEYLRFVIYPKSEASYNELPRLGDSIQQKPD